MLRMAGLSSDLLDADIYRKVVEANKELRQLKADKQSMQE